MSDLSHMSTSELKKEYNVLADDEKDVIKSIKVIESISGLYKGIELNITATAGAAILTTLLTVVAFIAFFLFSSFSIQPTSPWTIAWFIFFVSMIVSYKKSDSIKEKVLSLITETDNRDYSQLIKCEEGLIAFSKKTHSLFLAGSITAAFSLIIFIVTNVIDS